MGKIVVGVDGSDESRGALRWAAEEARVRGASLEVVYVYRSKDADVDGGQMPMMMTAGQAPTTRQRGASADPRHQARAVIDRMVNELEDRSGLSVVATPVEDRHTARALVDQARGADLLVVGSRGRGGFTGLVLGSVSQQCAHHATCPVTIVPVGVEAEARG